jgi:hypothetical protein
MTGDAAHFAVTERVYARIGHPGSVDPRADLASALREVRAAVGSAVYPLPTANAGAAGDGARALLAELDDHLLPRLSRLDAPLLCVVGGSTGAGKSTLVNSLIRAPVSPAGPLRPTTRAPLLACHPADATAFTERALLPGLPRSPRPGEHTLQVVNAPFLAPGLALLDTPDIDSVVAANRSQARELYAAGDLWLFVTTAARYADAVAWRILGDARRRGTAVAIVLDRVPPAGRDEISADFAQMLASVGLGDAALFVVAETTLDRHGLLPEADVVPIKTWLDSVARHRARRREVGRRTLFGAVASVGPRTAALANAADEQTAAAATLAGHIRSAYAGAMSDVESRLRGGAVLRGSVYTRWRELLASGDLADGLRSLRGRRPGRASGRLPQRGADFGADVGAAIVNLVVEVDVAAASECRRRWQSDSSGRALLDADPALGRPWAGFGDAAYDLVHAWQAWLRGLVAERPDLTAAGPAWTELLATVVVVAPPEATVTSAGAEASILRTVQETQTAALLGERARAELLVRVGDLLTAEVERHLAPIATARIDPGLARRLRRAADAVGTSGSGARGVAA